MSRRGQDVSMNALVRARIKDGKWVDEETIWKADIETYTPKPDMNAGGRIAFDDAGHVFLSVGMKGITSFWGIQDLSLPYGKIHRVHDDGRIPADNPFLGVPDALETTWTYGHRSPQGLEFNRRRGQLWSTEMGPRGGDELNLLKPGRNYGWPLYSLGLNYDGSPIEYADWLDITFELKEQLFFTNRDNLLTADRLELLLNTFLNAIPLSDIIKAARPALTQRSWSWTSSIRTS